MSESLEISCGRWLGVLQLRSTFRLLPTSWILRESLKSTREVLLESTRKVLLESTRKVLLELTRKVLLELTRKELLESTRKELLELTRKELLELAIRNLKSSSHSPYAAANPYNLGSLTETG